MSNCQTTASSYMLDTGFFSKKFTKKPVQNIEELINQVLSSESYETELELARMPTDTQKNHTNYRDDFDLIQPKEIQIEDNDRNQSFNGVFTTMSSSGKSQQEKIIENTV